jgi:hypothetical protein
MSDRSDDEYHKIFTALCQNIAREDSNTGQRVTWAIALSAGLFTAIAFLAPRANDVANGVFWPSIIWISISGIAGLGLFFSLKSWRGVRAAHRQIDYLRNQYETNAAQYNRLGLFRPFGDPTDSWGIESADIFPRTLMVFWFIVLIAAIVASIFALSRAALDSTVVARAATEAVPAVAKPAKP